MGSGNVKKSHMIEIIGLFLLFCATFLTGCSSTSNSIKEPAKPIYWPSSPELAKITYEGTIERPEDIATKKGLFQRALEFLLGTRTDRILKPYGIAVDSKGRLIVADTSLKRVHIFDRASGKYAVIDEYGDNGFVSPIGIAVDGEDNIYVSDPELNRIIVFSKKGKYLFEIKERLKRPTGIAINKKEALLYVVSTGSHNLNVYALNGKYLKTFGERGGEPGKFNFPTDISVDGAGSIYITDSMNFRIQIFDKDLTYISHFGRQGDGSGSFARPKGISVDSDGNIYVVDSLFDTVQIFDREGRLLLNFGITGQQKGEFWLPSGIVVDGSDRIFVSDTFNKRIQVFKYLKEEGSVSPAGTKEH